MERPPLTRELSPANFAAHYWLKSELVNFCRAQGLPTRGAKLEVAGRIVAFLETGEVTPARLSSSVRSVALAGVLGSDIVIPEGCRASQTLRAYFLAELGQGFHFNAFMRHYLRDHAGRTLGDAAEAWRADQAQGPIQREIDPQFEFNRHIRAYHEQHPGATRTEAIAAWKRERLRPG